MTSGDLPESTPIVVAAATDAAFLPLALVVAQSIARSATSDRPVEFHVLYDGPDHWALPRLERYAKGTVRAFVHRVPNPYQNLGEINGFPPSTFFRHAVQRVLSPHRRAIYLDLDVNVETDLAPLFDADLRGNAIGGVPCTATVLGALLARPDDANGDPAINWRAYFRDVLGFATDEEFLGFIQCGVLLFDLEMLRETGFEEDVARAAIEYAGTLRHAQQGVLNKIAAGRLTRLDPRWNRTVEALDRRLDAGRATLLAEQIKRQRTTPGIVHFNGHKPWARPFQPGAAGWWCNVALSGAAPDVLRRTFRYQMNSVFEFAAARLPGPYGLLRRAFRTIKPLPPGRR